MFTVLLFLALFLLQLQMSDISFSVFVMVNKL